MSLIKSQLTMNTTGGTAAWIWSYRRGRANLETSHTNHQTYSFSGRSSRVLSYQKHCLILLQWLGSRRWWRRAWWRMEWPRYSTSRETGISLYKVNDSAQVWPTPALPRYLNIDSLMTLLCQSLLVVVTKYLYWLQTKDTDLSSPRYCQCKQRREQS